MPPCRSGRLFATTGPPPAGREASPLPPWATATPERLSGPCSPLQPPRSDHSSPRPLRLCTSSQLQLQLRAGISARDPPHYTLAVMAASGCTHECGAHLFVHRQPWRLGPRTHASITRMPGATVCDVPGEDACMPSLTTVSCHAPKLKLCPWGLLLHKFCTGHFPILLRVRPPSLANHSIHSDIKLNDAMGPSAPGPFSGLPSLQLLQPLYAQLLHLGMTGQASLPGL